MRNFVLLRKLLIKNSRNKFARYSRKKSDDPEPGHAFIPGIEGDVVEPIARGTQIYSLIIRGQMQNGALIVG